MSRDKAAVAAAWKQEGDTVSPLPEDEDEDEAVYQALYEYQATQEGDLTFHEGDLLVITGPRVGTWWLARNIHTNRQGYIPHNFIKRKPSTRTRNSTEVTRDLTAKNDYTTSIPSALSFHCNQKVEGVCETGPALVRGRIAGSTEEGLVPRSYVTNDHQLSKEEWYHGGATREGAEAVLKGAGEGTFLVRESSQASSGYSISVVNQDVARHYLVYINPEGQVYVSQRCPFSTLVALVGHYGTHPGLCTTLTTPAKKKTPSPPLDKAPGESGGGRAEDPWEVDRECLTDAGESLGEGQFGQVYKAFWNGTILVAVKAMKHDCMRRNEFLREGETMRRLRHPRLVKLYGVVTKPEDQPLLLVTELVGNSSLLTQLRSVNSSGSPYGHGVLAKMAAQVASGMAYLASEKVIHRDLAARNILVAGNLSVKIADFGLARFIKNDFYLRRSDIKFPVKWTAPESLVHNVYTSKSDVWSYGIFLYELFTHGGIPYPGMNNREARHSIQDGEVNRCPPGCPSSVYGVMLDCWQLNPTNRPAFSILLPALTSLSDTLGPREEGE